MTQHDLAAVIAYPPRAPLPQNVELARSGDLAAVLTVRAQAETKRDRLAHAVGRQRLLEDLLASGPVLPAAPDTRVTDEDVDAMLALQADRLRHGLAQVCERVQFQIVLSWQESEALGRFRWEPEIEALFDRPPIAGRRLAKAVSRLSRRLADSARREIASVAEDAIDLPPPEASLCHQAVLIGEADVPALDAALERIDSVWPEGFRLRRVGPAPAVSFALLTLDWMNREDLARARHRLQAPEGAADLRALRRAALKRGLGAQTVETDIACLELAARSPQSRRWPLVILRREGPSAQVGSAVERVA